jgi:serine/threonine-protein kinase RsbW
VTLTARDTSARAWSREVEGVFGEIGPSLAWIESLAHDLHLSEDQDYALRLCAEELITNVVVHNKESAPGADALRLCITVAATKDRVALTIEDNGVHFDIVKATAKTADQPIDQIQIGGLGVGLVKRFASRLHYNRTERGNKVVAEFY